MNGFRLLKSSQWCECSGLPSDARGNLFGANISACRVCGILGRRILAKAEFLVYVEGVCFLVVEQKPSQCLSSVLLLDCWTPYPKALSC